MSRLSSGKAKFYGKCKLDRYTKQIIKFYNDNLRFWKCKEEYINFNGSQDEANEILQDIEHLESLLNSNESNEVEEDTNSPF